MRDVESTTGRAPMIVLLLCLALAALCQCQSNFVSVTYTAQRILWFDNRGDQIDAYGAQIKCLSPCLSRTVTDWPRRAV
jgi:hypothetical protein